MRHQGIFEYYHSQSGEPPSKAAEAFGWSAAVFIDLAISASNLQDPSPLDHYTDRSKHWIKISKKNPDHIDL